MEAPGSADKSSLAKPGLNAVERFRSPVPVFRFPPSAFCLPPFLWKTQHPQVAETAAPAARFAGFTACGRYVRTFVRRDQKPGITNCDTYSRKIRRRRSDGLHRARRRHASSVLRSRRAVQVNIAIMRASVRLRAMLMSTRTLARKLLAFENKYDAQFRVVFDAIRELMEGPSPPPKPRIGFRP